MTMGIDGKLLWVEYLTFTGEPILPGPFFPMERPSYQLTLEATLSHGPWAQVGRTSQAAHEFILPV